MVRHIFTILCGLWNIRPETWSWPPHQTWKWMPCWKTFFDLDISHSLPAAIISSLSLSLSVALFLMPRVSSDFNAPDKEQVFKFMDKAVLESGVNLVDTVST